MKVIIEVEDLETAGAACSYVADRLDEGYRSGMIGCTSLSWYVDKEEEA